MAELGAGSLFGQFEPILGRLLVPSAPRANLRCCSPRLLSADFEDSCINETLDPPDEASRKPSMLGLG